MSVVNDDFPDHILSLLGQLMDSVRREVLDRSPAGGLRSSQIRLLSLTPTDGLRMTDLAARVGMTKQALGEFATELIAAGHLEAVGDPTDRRVRILRPTVQGLRALDTSTEVIEDIEARRRAAMGRDWDRLRALLQKAIDRTTG